MDFDNPKVYGDTSITDGLVFYTGTAFGACDRYEVVSSVVFRMTSDDLRCFRCSQLFSNVFSWVVTFMDNHPRYDA